jgi:hypothetical protein
MPSRALLGEFVLEAPPSTSPLRERERLVARAKSFRTTSPKLAPMSQELSAKKLVRVLEGAQTEMTMGALR